MSSEQSTPETGRVLSHEEAEARKHIAAIVETQRAARGTMESVSAPRVRRRSRRLHLRWLWITEVVGDVWRRIDDSHRWPGRWAGRLRLSRPFKALSIWVVLWAALAAASAIVAFDESVGDPWAWLAKWSLGAALAAFIAVIWHDVVKSPHTVWQVRRRIVAEPAALLRTTLAPQTTKIVELDPPLDTVPRDSLYDELLPGVLARKKDVQIIVGDPGAGKTTALLDLASVLAKIGFVPVLLELRGERTSEDLSDLARKRFEQQVRPYVRTSADADIVWRWLSRRQRLAILVDDIDQIGFDGEPGFVMRRLLENVATEGQAVLVTARPAGVPVGIAASAINIDPLDFKTAIDLVTAPLMREPGATVSATPPRGRIEHWVRGGNLTEAPLYLEALTELTSVGACPDLPDDPSRWAHSERPGRWRELSKRKREWNPLWVRYMLLDRFYAAVIDGSVRRSLAIDEPDRARSVRSLAQAALGSLGASGLDATSAAGDAGQAVEAARLPKRKTLVEFIGTDDRRGLGTNGVDAKTERRRNVSRHEAIDTGERLRILERDWKGDPQFRHRIMQAFLAGRCLAELGRSESSAFDGWVKTLMDHHHPEKLTAHLALTFAAIYADDLCLKEQDPLLGDLGEKIVRQLVEDVEAPDGEITLAEQLDPLQAPDPQRRKDPDDELIKLTTAANIAALLRQPEKLASEPAERRKNIARLMTASHGAVRWTKLQAIPAIAGLDSEASWLALWTHFTCDSDYDVRRAASKQLEKNACCAYPPLGPVIEAQILGAGHRAARGLELQSPNGATAPRTRESFTALGWVLPAIVSGLSEEVRAEHEGRAEADLDETKPGPGEAGADGKAAAELDSHESCLRHARARLAEFATLAYEGGRPDLEESLAQGFKADAMRHASDPAKTFTGPGWVASNRRLVADIGLPHAESWYARMLLYQALALYAISGASRDDTLDMLAHRLHSTRERHPLARKAAALARGALRRAELGRQRWEAFVWSDDVEDAGRLPAALSHDAAQLVGDVAILVDLKEGSPPDRHHNFGHMEELPYCLSASPNRHEILGAGCPAHCGWGFCPYRAASPDEPNEHRGLSRGFCRGERRIALGKRPPSWQGSISKRRMREFWEQMEYKARR